MIIGSKHQSEWQGILTDWSSGLDRSRPPYLIDDTALFNAINFYYDPVTGYPTTRPGLKKWSAAAMPAGVIGVFEAIIGGVSTVVAVCEDQKLYAMDGSNTPQPVGSVAGAERPSFQMMNGKLVLCTGGIQSTDLVTIGAKVTDFTYIADFEKGVAMDAYARILGVGDPANLERFGMSKVKDPDNWTYAAAPEDDAKRIDIGYLNGCAAVGLAPFMGDVFVFKRSPYSGRREIYRVIMTDAASANWSVRRVTRSASTLSPHFVVEVGDVFFMDLEGPKRLSRVEGFGDMPYVVDPYGSRIAGELSQYLQPDGFSIYDPVRRLMMVKPTKNSTSFYCVDAYNERWTYFAFGPNIQSGAYCQGKMLFGAADGWIYEYDPASYQDDGAQYSMVLETKWFDLSPLFLNILKNLYLNVVGITGGSLTLSVKVAGQTKMSKVYDFAEAWWSWDLVNSITPEDWTESLTKTLSGYVRDNRPVSADQFSVEVTVTQGLCAIGQLGGRIATTGRA